MNIEFVDTAGLEPDSEGTEGIQPDFVDIEEVAPGLGVEHLEMVSGIVGFGRLLPHFLSIAA